MDVAGSFRVHELNIILQKRVPVISGTRFVLVDCEPKKYTITVSILSTWRITSHKNSVFNSHAKSRIVATGIGSKSNVDSARPIRQWWWGHLLSGHPNQNQIVSDNSQSSCNG